MYTKMDGKRTYGKWTVNFYFVGFGLFLFYISQIIEYSGSNNFYLCVGTHVLSLQLPELVKGLQSMWGPLPTT